MLFRLTLAFSGLVTALNKQEYIVKASRKMANTGAKSAEAPLPL